MLLFDSRAHGGGSGGGCFQSIKKTITKSIKTWYRSATQRQKKSQKNTHAKKKELEQTVTVYI